jgi:pimeloyl-ACP methyl ester carboxylesterase
MMKKLSVVGIVLLLMFVLSRCFVLHRYMRSDKELESHYCTQQCKPTYKDVPFLKRNVHYAVISKNDTLPLLVFVHGAPGAWYGYMNLMDDTILQKKYKMIAVDRLGYGKSGYGQPETSTGLQALSIKAIIDKENITGKKVTLVGRSYGAPITAWLAINYPQQVDRLFMISPVIDPDREKFYWFSEAGKWAPVQWMLPELLNVATTEKFAHEKEMEKMLPKWEKLYVPTTVVSGAADRIADTANFYFAKRHLVNCDTTLMMLENTGHLVTAERPAVIKDLILNGKKPSPVLQASR